MKKKTNSIKNGKKSVKVARESKPLTKQKLLPPSTGWKKVKIAGRLMSDDGGTGLEGLMGLEVLENSEAPIARQKIEKVSIAGATVWRHCPWAFINLAFCS